MNEADIAPPTNPVGFGHALRTWTRVACLSFGGPAGQIAVMHRIVVDEKAWVSEQHFLHALSFCTVLPGPEAQQLAIYLGWLMHRTRGGIAAGLIFVLPGLVALMALSVIYAGWGRVGPVAALFFGLRCAVFAVVLQAVLRVGRRALRRRALVGVAAAAFIAVFFFKIPFPAVILAAGAAGWSLSRQSGPRSPIARLPPETAGLNRQAVIWLTLWLAPTVSLLVVLGPGHVFTQIAVFFSELAVVTFGGAYAMLAYVAQQGVDHYHWLRPGEMLDGLGLAETTPGPLVMVNQFVGFLAAYRHASGLPPMLAGAVGGLLASWVTFAPCFLWVFLGAPYVEALRGHRALAGALSAITACVVGVILNLAVWFALHVLFRATVPVRGFGLAFDAPVLASLDVTAACIALAAAVAIFGFRLGLMPTLAGGALAGLAVRIALPASVPL